MLKEAPYVIIPVFRSKGLNGEYVSILNPFATIWCVIENIFLAATAEGLSCSMRIPLNQEHDTVKEKLKVSCVCSQLSLIFRHPSPSTSMYFTLFPYFFPCEESIREKVFFSS